MPTSAPSQALLRAWMAALGLPPGELLHDDPARPSVVTRIAGAGGGPHLLLNGHLDTKPVGDRAAWATDPARRGRSATATCTASAAPT